VVLSGCGVYDGSEIHESVSVLLGISQTGAKYKCFAPNIEQLHVINHMTGKTMDETRNVLVESARIARGDIDDIKILVENVMQYDAVFFPGGFGAAKNLSNFATTSELSDYEVNADVASVIQKFHQERKPIGLCCISPVLAAKVLNCKVTIGSNEDVAKRIAAVGSSNVSKNSEEINVDKDNLIVTTPAYMCDTTLDKIFEGIQKMVVNVLQLVREKGI